MTQKEAGLLVEVQQYIHTNLHRPIPVASICREFHVNKTKLQGQFREILGLSLHAFMLRARMEKASTLLRESDHPVKYIAWECGYRKVRSFNKAFKNHWQLSPDRYRRSDRMTESNTDAAKSHTR
ncbi:MAG TPA: AraC family transcriptional regulator [Puia sp.]|jgi:AraC-like DNA-binding protein